MARAHPPEDISPEAFFCQWVPQRVAEDTGRQHALRHTEAAIEFCLTGGPTPERFTVRIDRGEVEGVAGADGRADLRVTLSTSDWRDLNAGRLTAPEAFLKRKVKLEGDLVLAVKLHLILG